MRAINVLPGPCPHACTQFWVHDGYMNDHDSAHHGWHDPSHHGHEPVHHEPAHHDSAPRHYHSDQAAPSHHYPNDAHGRQPINGHHSGSGGVGGSGGYQQQGGGGGGGASGQGQQHVPYQRQHQVPQPQQHAPQHHNDPNLLPRHGGHQHENQRW